MANQDQTPADSTPVQDIVISDVPAVESHRTRAIAPDSRANTVKKSLPPGTEGEKDSARVSDAISIGRANNARTNSATAMLQKRPANVLPLHLAPIDSFFLADDHPRYPMTSLIRMEFTGQINPEAFYFALEEATARHPLMRAVIRPMKRGLPCWTKDAAIAPTVDWGPVDKPVTFETTESIDLTNESGLRFWIRGDESQTDITLQVHHACTDGTGVYRFLGDLLAVYGQQTADEDAIKPELSEIDTKMLRNRRARIAGITFKAKRSELIRLGVRQSLDVFASRITPLATPNKDAQSIRTPFPGVFCFQFNRDEHKQLRNTAGDFGAMLNDLLMAEMFRTVMRWNAEQGKPVRGKMRILMPSDLREQQDYPMPATNMTAYTFLTRKPGQCDDLKSLMKGIREETARIKHDQLGRRFMDTAEFAANGHSILKFLLRRNRCNATTILSNVGDPSRRFTASFPRDKGRVIAGNLRLEEISGVPPMRLKTHATLAIFSYRRNLTLCVRCDPYRFTPEDGNAFISMYADQLKSHLSD